MIVKRVAVLARFNKICDAVEAGLEPSLELMCVAKGILEAAQIMGILFDNEEAAMNERLEALADMPLA